MRKILALMLAAMFLFVGCGSSKETSKTEPPPQGKQNKPAISTLGMTFSNFEKRFVDIINEMMEKSDGGEPLEIVKNENRLPYKGKRRENDTYEQRIYEPRDNVTFTETVYKKTNEITEITVVISNLPKEKKEGIWTLAYARLFYDTSIKAINTDFSEKNLDEIISELGLDKRDVLNGVDETKSIVYKGKSYFHGIVQGKGIVFSISTP